MDTTEKEDIVDIVGKVKGLIRPFITVCFVVTVTILALLGKIESKEILQITGIIVAFYFAERAALKKPNSD